MRKRILFFAMVVLGLALLRVDLASAFSADEIFFENGSSAAFPPIGLVKQKGNHYLYLPACWDARNLVPHYEGESLSFRADDVITEMPAGASVDLPIGKIEFLDKRGNRMCRVIVMQGSLPAVFLTLPPENLSEIHSNKGNTSRAEMIMAAPDGAVTYSGEVSQMKIRGNTTAYYDKKPYQIKLSKKTELIEGAGKGKTWILLADYLDLSLVRNRMTLDMARFVGLSNTPACQSVDLYINQEYYGVYLLCEKVQIGSSRVDITDQEDSMEVYNGSIEPERFEMRSHETEDGARITYFDGLRIEGDISGGYLVVMEKKHRVQEENEHSAILTANGFGLVIKEPSLASLEQTAYVAQQLSMLERAIISPGGIDPITGKGLSQIADLDSFVLKCILEDVCDNYDAKSGSLFFYKDIDSVDTKWYAGPGWDYDLTFYNGLQVKPQHSILKSQKIRDSWWAYMYNNSEEFRLRASELYRERFMPALRILLNLDEPPRDSALRSMDAYLTEMSASIEMNFTRWLYSKIDGYDRSSGRTHEDSVKFVRRYIEERMSGLYSFYCE